ncbi:MAG TPA: phospholipid carrier-dependent glycosyltransferase [Gemmatimonadaceae bacterium]|nr:phospholipid carrier-dependent glycosyltransferase [Gemmatimonadaceae bacterium]
MKAARPTRSIWTPELVVLAALAGLTRFWNLFTPNVVAFDEMHFEHHAGHYLAGTHYFDVHPPLGKLLFAAEAKFFGISSATLLAGEPAVALRVLPACFGALIVPLIYVLCRQLGAARRVAALASFAILCENALLVDSRFSLLEPFIIGFGLSAIVLYLAAARATGFSHWLGLAASALMAGCALSVKWTGLSALGIILSAWALDVVLSARRADQWRRVAIEGLVLVGIPIAVYVSVFAVHFHVLRRTGIDDAVMSAQFRATMVGGPMYNPAVHMSLFAKLSDVHKAISRGNSALEGITHAAASPWYTWPIMKHPIGLWEGADAQRPAMVILLGNPVLWWGSGIAVLVAGVLFASRRRQWGEHRYALAFLLGAFLLNFLPFIAIRRVMYIYHYLYALLFLITLAIMSLGVIAGWNDPDDGSIWRFSSRASASWYWGVAAMVLLGFLYFAPFSYGWSLTPTGYDARFWILHPHF